MSGCIFSRQYGTQRETAAVLGIVCNDDRIGIRLIFDGMNARNLASADSTDRQLIGSTVGCSADRTVRSGQCSGYPLLLTVKIFQNAFG